MLKEIRLFTAGSEYAVCHVCAHECKVKEDKFGICGTKKNISGVLYDVNYGIIAAQFNDPVEKKPLFHFLPGSFSYSIGSPGCNFRCSGCLNADISQTYRDDDLKAYRNKIASIPETEPHHIVERAIACGAKSISYTYTEPSVFLEYGLEVMEKAFEKGLKNIFVTNGYFTDVSINALGNYLDAANIDIKFFNDRSYRKVCGGTIRPVLNTIEKLFASGVHIELATLLIEGYNDSEEELKGIAGYISQFDKNIPWHISKFIPYYKMKDVAETGTSSIQKAYEMGRVCGLNYIYAAGSAENGHMNTICPSCKNVIVNRKGFYSDEVKITAEGLCGYCGFEIYGYFNDNGLLMAY